MLFGISVVVFFVAAFYCLKRLMQAGDAARVEEASENARREEERRRRQQLQTDCRSRVKQACEVAENAFSAIPSYLVQAESLLARSEREFEERAFSPFWEAIESAVRQLANVDQNLRLIESSSRSYADAAKKIVGTYPSFPVDVQLAHELAAAGNTGEHLRSVVRKAQKDFQFATIFEQRKTTEVLIAGFHTLGEAIYGVGDSISASLGAVQESVRSMHVDLASAMEAQRVQQQRIAEAEAADREAAMEQEVRSNAAASSQMERAIKIMSDLRAGREADFLDRDR